MVRRRMSKKITSEELDEGEKLLAAANRVDPKIVGHYYEPTHEEWVGWAVTNAPALIAEVRGLREAIANQSGEGEFSYVPCEPDCQCSFCLHERNA